MMANTSAVRDSRTARVGWRWAAAAVIVCVLACTVAQADVEYVDFCDYYPLAVGNTWETEVFGYPPYTANTKVTEHFVVNGVDVWKVVYGVPVGGEVVPFSEIYSFFLNDYFYMVFSQHSDVLDFLPELPAEVAPFAARRYPVGVPIEMPGGYTVTAYHGSLADIRAIFGGCMPAGASEDSNALALVRDDYPYPQIFVEGLGLLVQFSSAIPEKDMSYGLSVCNDPILPILNEGCPNPLFLTSTNLGEVWEAGTVQRITWQRDTEVAGPDVRIGLHKGAAFVDWIVRKTANDGEYAWLIPPDLAPGDDYRLRIQSFTDSSIVDYSDGTFSITPPALALTVPNGGEALQAVKTQTIAWLGDDPAVGPDVRLGLHKGATFVGWITRRTSNDGEFNWIIPEGLPAASNYRLRIQSFTDSAIRDFSDRRFAIVK